MKNKKVAGASSSKVQPGQGEQDATRKVAGASSSRAQDGQREQDAPATLVMELRIPEFREDGKWTKGVKHPEFRAKRTTHFLTSKFSPLNFYKRSE
jgi:hypothetical protein